MRKIIEWKPLHEWYCAPAGKHSSATSRYEIVGEMLTISTYKGKTTDKWYVTCRQINLQSQELEATELIEAQAEAVRFVAGMVAEMRMDLVSISRAPLKA
jgi:hypothetical protein